ncbi:MAG TPA: 16S rRNA (guanine(527)-N(7))-methyltransferase RsmG [Deltaproteobacteria bacterium]|nr:16S rRNA (guanine(527)-N(7))-methyltransferase RsmG [Deltaproteobacteria bacterium]
MEVSSPEWKRLIQDGAKEMGIDIDPEQTEQCAIHAEELLRWARKINLTAITDPAEMAVKHYLDSLAPAPWFPEELPRLLDMGTGGGFPGIPLKIYFKSMPVTLMDASRKKTNFLKHVIRMLDLEKVEVIQTRVEDISSPRSYDIIVSRAVSNITKLCKMASPLLAPDGTIIAFLGKEADAGKLNLADTLYDIELKPYVLPYLDLHRALAFIRKR